MEGTMPKAYVVTGNLKDGRVVELDEPVPVANVRVRVSIEPLSAATRRSLDEVIAEIRATQAARGFVPPTREEVDLYLAEERESWER